MAIGTAAALLGSAVIGGVGSAISSGNNNKAINKATDASVQAQRENNALTRDIYGQNKNILMPYVNSGYQANSAINALLGLPANDASVGTVQPQAQPNALSGANMPAYKRQQLAEMGVTVPAQTAATPTPAASATSPVDYNQAFQQYLGSTGYQFRMGEGQKGLNASFAARGIGNSGAAAKAALAYGQNIASDEFGRYLGYLGNQQGLGLSAGNALAGVGTNYVNTIAANNNALASTLGNSAIAKANNSNALIGNLSGLGGWLAGGLSSYGGLR